MYKHVWVVYKTQEPGNNITLYAVKSFQAALLDTTSR